MFLCELGQTSANMLAVYSKNQAFLMPPLVRELVMVAQEAEYTLSIHPMTPQLRFSRCVARGSGSRSLGSFKTPGSSEMHKVSAAFIGVLNSYTHFGCAAKTRALRKVKTNLAKDPSVTAPAHRIGAAVFSSSMSDHCSMVSFSRLWYTDQTL